MQTISNKKMTADEFAEYAVNHEGRCELIRGEVRHLSPTGEQHGDVTGFLHYLLYRHVHENKLGKVYAAETGFQITESRGTSVRAPDIAFIEKARVVSTPKFSKVIPDLVVETLSPSDKASEVNAKNGWWLDNGAKLVWVVDPQNQTVTVLHPDGQSTVLDRDNTLTGENVLPGFELKLTELFKAD